MGYNKSTLRQQRTKYENAITHIDTSITKLESIKQELEDKTKYGGITGIETVKTKINTSITDLKTAKTNLNNTIIQLTKEINRPVEENEIEGWEV